MGEEAKSNVVQFTPRVVTRPVGQPSPGPRYELETGNTFLNRWVLR
jgi:hypothetical protein